MAIDVINKNCIIFVNRKERHHKLCMSFWSEWVVGVEWSGVAWSAEVNTFALRPVINPADDRPSLPFVMKMLAFFY